eukprot:6013574-Alexandrium_andersonii.AAC.1
MGSLLSHPKASVQTCRVRWGVLVETVQGTCIGTARLGLRDLLFRSAVLGRVGGRSVMAEFYDGEGGE